MIAWPARTSRTPPRCVTRNSPCKTTVNSVNSGVWPGSDPTAWTAHVGDAELSVVGIHPTDVFINPLRWLAGCFDPCWLGNQGWHGLGPSHYGIRLVPRDSQWVPIPWRGSCQHLLDRLGGRLDDADGPADVGVVLLVESMPRARPTVAEEVGHGHRPLLDRHAVALVLPMTWPPLMPPPASTVVQEVAQWSRPFARGRSAACGRTRPSTRSASSRAGRAACRSSISVAQAGSSTSLSFCTLSKLFWCVSQPRPVTPGACESVTSTNGTPRSTSRRASRQPWPNRLRP